MRPCVRCLIDGLPGEEALAEALRERIAQIAPEEKVTEAEYRRRLDACLSCGSLNHGTCALCGCYAEIRAARRRMGCPRVPPRWLPEE